ncbi:MAG: BMP family ABC transporter substrate-binding protein [Oscillospiraceae bacterium]|nr:BMP family ABC transporter substrate-binding protein [Oscillospiraceae bacterium]
MSIQTALEEYAQALRQGQKEYRELLMAGKDPHPAVLDEILPEGPESALDIGTLEIPAERIVGVKTRGRITAFTATFKPLLEAKSEFANKWVHLCMAHLGETGITDPILCYEYLGNFYVQEGNKRVSVLRHFGAPRIPGTVKRILPPMSDDPRIKAYYEFLDFYKVSKLYTIQFRRPGDYARMLSYLGKKSDEIWTEEERRTFNAYFHYFMDAFTAQNTKGDDVLPEEALLLWLNLYPFQDLGRMTAAQLKKSLAALWEDILSTTKQDSVKVKTRAEDESNSNLFIRIASALDCLNVAFVHQLTPAKSTWVLSHEEGREHIERVFGDRINVRSYFDANTPEQAEQLIEQAVSDGAQVVFTTSPPLSRATLKAAVKYPKVRFLNCSVDQPYSSIRTYYGRMYEAKFITGAIAGAMAGDDRIGYITSYPIFGVPASINAFALGAQMTNPRAQIELRWSCLPGTPQADFFADGIRVISNRSVPTQSQMYLDFCSYGTYLMDDLGDLVPLASPTWVWGKFYEFVLRNVFSGGWKHEKGESTALNYWLGMDSGVIGLKLSDKLPEGVRRLAKILQRGMADGSIDPFFRRIVAQDGTVKNDGSRTFTPAQILHMDWLCSNVIGSIPPFEEILPISQNMVRELGIYRDKVPPEKEAKPREDFDRIR